MGDFLDDVEDDLKQADTEELLRKVAQARGERDVANRALKASEADVARLTDELETSTAIEGANVKAKPWGKRPPKKPARKATATLLLSDWHFDEVVNPAELVGPDGEPLNAYNRDIAEKRLRKCVDGACVVATELLNWSWDGMVLQLGGDLISGSIHDELAESNEGVSPLDTVDYWVDHLAAALVQLADTFGKLHVVAVVGNHGRLTRKPRAKGRVRSNFDWMLIRMLVRWSDGDSRITWHVPDAADAYWTAYGHRQMLTHGDQARGGSGISGLLTPISLLDHRKRKRDGGAAADQLWLGHWHSFVSGPGWCINGAGKGYDEFSYSKSFPYEVPQQAFGVLTPEHGLTSTLPVYCADRAAEGW